MARRLISDRVMCILTLILFAIYVQQTYAQIKITSIWKWRIFLHSIAFNFLESASFNESCYFDVSQTKQLENIHKIRSVFACKNLIRIDISSIIFFVRLVLRHAYMCTTAASKIGILIVDNFIHQQMCALHHSEFNSNNIKNKI